MTSSNEEELLVCEKHKFYAYAATVPCPYCRIEALEAAVFHCVTDYAYIASELGKAHSMYDWLLWRKAQLQGRTGDAADWQKFALKLMEFLEAAPLETGVCGCGASMEGHPDPLDCGHTATDAAAYTIFCFQRELEKLQSEGKVPAAEGKKEGS